MDRVKIVQRFFSKSKAVDYAAYLRSKAKKENILIPRVEIVNAYALFKTNGWFKKSPYRGVGMPTADTFMVIVHYDANLIKPVPVEQLRNKIVKAVKKNRVRKHFFIVKLSPVQQKQMEKSKQASINRISMTIGVQFKRLVTYFTSKNKMWQVIRPLDVHYKIAA